MAIEPRSLVTAIGLIALAGFFMYRRIRRTVGRQQFRPRRLWIRMIILGVICLLALGFHVTDLETWIAAIVGGLAGGALGFFSLRHTVFEDTPEGRFFTPHTIVGLGVSAVFIARIVYRFFAASPAVPATAAHHQGVVSSFTQSFNNPLTLGIYFALAGYYIVSYAGILARFKKPTSPELPASP